MLQVTGIERKFIIKRGNEAIELSDPNTDWTPERVKSFFEDNYSELTNATIDNKGIIDDVLVYEFGSNPKVKG